MKIHVFLIPILPLLIPAGLGEWWSTSWAQHHGTEHFHPEGPKAHRLCAPDQSTVYPSFHFLQKGAIIMYLNDCNVCICILCSIINVDIANVKKADFFHSAFSKDFCRVVKWEIFFFLKRCSWKTKRAIILRLSLFSIRLVFSNARGRAQSAVTPVLQRIQTPTMRMISAVQRRIAVKVLGLSKLYYDFRKPL